MVPNQVYSNSDASEQSNLDVSSEDPPRDSKFESKQGSAIQGNAVQGSAVRKNAAQGRQKVQFHFGCCRVATFLLPPQHVLEGKSNTWRIHCPRCGRLTEVLVQ